MGRLAITSEPNVEPLTVASLKTHLRIDTADEDSYLTTLITFVRRFLETELQRTFVNTTYTYTIGGFTDPIKLPRPPVSSISGITYLDVDNSSTALSSSIFELVNDKVYLKYQQAFPATLTRVNAVVVTYVAGFGATAADVPAEYIHLIKLICGSFYENREAHYQSPFNFRDMALLKNLLHKYRHW